MAIINVKSKFLWKEQNYQLIIVPGMITVIYENPKQAKKIYLMKAEQLKQSGEIKNLQYDNDSTIIQLFPGLTEEHLVESVKAEFDPLVKNSGKAIKFSYTIA